MSLADLLVINYFNAALCNDSNPFIMQMFKINIINVLERKLN